MSGRTKTYECKRCKQPFVARVADRARGWARYCSKSCKAVAQEARTGQYGAYLRAENGGLLGGQTEHYAPDHGQDSTP